MGEYEYLVAKIVPLILDALLANSTAAGEIETVASLDNIKALAAYRRVGGTEKTVEVPLDILMRPTDDAEAERVMAETSRVNAENSRVTAEEQRVAAETGRDDAEQARATAEAGREDAEGARVTAEDKRESDTTERLDAADEAIDRLNDLSDHPAKIVNGYWQVWDEETQTYVERGASGFVIIAFFATLDDLRAAVPVPHQGDAYGVGSAAPYDIYVFDGVREDWVDNGQLQGAPGASAYELWLADGNNGTVADFLNSLKGKTGKSAYGIAIANGYVGTVEEWLNSLKGVGNVEVTADGLIAGKQYAFVPDEDGSPIGTFQEIEIPDQQVQADAAQTDETAPDYIKNLPTAARTGNYGDLLGIPQLNGGIEKDVAEMFNIPTQGDVKCIMTDSGVGKPMINIFGTDTSGETNPLVITAALGFGSYYERIGDDAIVQRGQAAGVVTDHLIQVTAESDDTPTTISIPAACNYFEVKYFVGQTNVRRKSYFETLDGVIYPFNLADTPVANFVNATSGAEKIVTIGGVQVATKNVRKLYFGQDYSSIEVLPNYFLGMFSNMTTLDMSNMVSIISTGTMFCRNCTSLSKLYMFPMSNFTVIQDGFFNMNSSLTSFDMSTITNVVAISGDILRNCTSIVSLDLSQMGNVKTFRTYPFYGLTGLMSLQLGNVDWSTVPLPPTAFYNLLNSSSRILYADSDYVAQTFKSKIPRVSTWSVVINPAA